MLTRDQILSAADARPEPVDVPEWGGGVFVRVMTGAQRDRFEGAFARDRHDNLRARLAAYTVCDEAGALLFGEADVSLLGAKSSAALDRVFPVAMRVNRLSREDVADLVKNSEASPSAASASG